MSRPIKVLVVEDSLTAQKVLVRILSADREVTGKIMETAHWPQRA